MIKEVHVRIFIVSLPLSAFPDDYSKDLYKAHTEEMYKGLLIHLDDPSSQIQVRVDTNDIVDVCLYS